MNYLSAEGITKMYGEKMLFKDISISVNKGQKVALIAKNGTGKSSLLRILIGKDSSDGLGKVITRKGIKVGYLDQEPDFPENETIIEAVYNDPENPILQAIHAYEKALLKQEMEPSPTHQAALEKAMEKMQLLEAWDYEVKIKQILETFNIRHIDRKIGLLSGGERKRVSLASILVREPDLLVMDEPTNHLDLEMVEWLEKYLTRQNLTLLLVTHDRYFLDRVTTEIIELHNGQIYQYKGNYAYFLEKKAERRYNLLQEVDKAKKLMKKESAWVNSQPKARTTKSKSRVDAFEKIKEKAFQNTKEDEVNFDDMKIERIGGKTVNIEYITKAYGDQLILKDFHYVFKRREKVGIVGRNGIGKSTLLRMVVGEEKPDAGRIVVGQTVVFGHYKQDGIKIDRDKKVIDVIRDVAEVLPLTKGRYLTAAQVLNHFQFPYFMHQNYVFTLSGGEKRRLYLLTILMQNPNFLIMDEPTNDLDLLTLDLLEDFLAKYQGCLLVVTHDRYFMDKIVDHVFVFEGDGKVRDFPGNYSQYREAKKKEDKLKQEQKRLAKEQAEQNANNKKNKAANKTKTKLSYNEKREFERLETEIEQLEDEKAGLEEQLNKGAGTHEELMQWASRLGDIVAAIETKSDRWLELSEFA